MSDSLPPTQLRPDYRGGGIVNLMASLEQGRGGAEPHHPPATLLSDIDLQQYRSIVLLVIDGLGYEQLTSSWQHSELHHHLAGRLTSVFPTTTAAAITTFLTGHAPARHGLTGWHMWLEEVGAVVAVLPFHQRGGHGEPLVARGYRVEQLLQPDPIFARLSVASHVVSPSRIAWSPFNQAFTRGATTHAFESLAQMYDQIARLCRKADSDQYIYAYWPELDHLAHQHGSASVEVSQHFEELDAGFSALLPLLKETNTLLLVCADHGFIDSSDTSWIHLERHAALTAMLDVPLCGEPRAAYCYVHDGESRAFESYLQTELPRQIQLVTSDTLVQQAVFGPGPQHPQLASRIGDFTLLMQDNFCISDTIAGERRPQLIGVHGGLSQQELFVPLVVASS